MPLTPFQIEVLGVLAANRSAASHIAGGLVLNTAPDSPRFSEDIDIFHDAEEAVIATSEKDCACLAAAGYAVTRQLWEPAFRRVWAERNGEGVKVEWAQDAAWRFFPIESDPILCWRLHPFDALTNKALAMGSRSETRDLVDLVNHAGRFPLHALVWAACAKDPGWTPMLLLEQMRRNARLDAAALREMGSRISPTEIKSRWLALAELAEVKLLAAAHAGIEIGLAFLSPSAEIAWHDMPSNPHRASLGGVVPRLGGVHYPIQ